MGPRPQWMALENCYEATLPIAEISGRLKIVVKCRWVLGLLLVNIDRHGLIPRVETIRGGGFVQLETG